MIKIRLHQYENFHIVLWLLKDTCWLMEWKLEGVIMAVPTIALAFFIIWLGRKKIDNLFHNLALTSWLRRIRLDVWGVLFK